LYSPVIETPNERRRYRGAGLLLILGGRSIWQFLARSPLSASAVPRRQTAVLSWFFHFLAKTAASSVFQSRHARMACMKVNSPLSPCGILRAVRQREVFEANRRQKL
jgi:hypothetical protein